MKTKIAAQKCLRKNNAKKYKKDIFMNLEGPGFKSRPGDRLSWLKSFRFSRVLPGKYR
jgi:hypothetical protein